MKHKGANKSREHSKLRYQNKSAAATQLYEIALESHPCARYKRREKKLTVDFIFDG